MRALILTAVAALGLAACGNNDQSDNTTNVDENLTAENIVSNDVTAIDAVTGASANMAADVEYNDVDNGLDNAVNALEAAPAGKPPAKPSRPATPASNTATNTAE